MVAPLKLAISGATGFVGGRLLDLALDAGHQVRALTRRPQPPREGVIWIDGALDLPDTLERLVDGAEAVIHVAGVINAPDAAGFEVGNVNGTAAMLAASEAASVARFVHVSSLAAREPAISLYGASKSRSETLVEASPMSTTIVRPPAVYGPGDRETLDLFKMAKRGHIFVPPRGRLSLIHVDDLARLLLALSAPDTANITVEPDDGRPGGWSHREFGDALARAVGSPARTVAIPRLLMSVGARLDRLVRGRQAKLTPDRVAYFCHHDWVASPLKSAPPELWSARIDTEQGLAGTARWYRAQRWL